MLPRSTSWYYQSTGLIFAAMTGVTGAKPLKWLEPDT